MLERLNRLDQRLLFRRLWVPDQPWPRRWDRKGSPGPVGRAAHRHPRATTIAWTLLYGVGGFLANPIVVLIAGDSPDFSTAGIVGVAFTVLAVVPVQRRVVALRRAYERFSRRDRATTHETRATGQWRG